MRKLFLFLAITSLALAGCSSGSSPSGAGGNPGTGGGAGMSGTGGTPGMGGTGGSVAKCTTPAEILRCDGVVLNIAHRGGRREWPEHTLLAYEEALKSGSNVLELDLHATSDNVIVVMHDSRVDRTTDGTGAIKEMTFEEIRALEAGYDFTTDMGSTFPYRGVGLKVPTLEEVLEAFPDAPYVIEIKQGEPSIVDDFVAMARKFDAVDQMNGAAFDTDVLIELRAAAPEMWTSYGENEVLEFWLAANTNPGGIPPEYEPPAEFLQVPPNQQGIDVLTPEFMEGARSLGLKVHVWTINDEEDMVSLIEDTGVDGIMTDYPSVLTTVIEETGTGL